MQILILFTFCVFSENNVFSKKKKIMDVFSKKKENKGMNLHLYPHLRYGILFWRTKKVPRKKYGNDRHRRLPADSAHSAGDQFSLLSLSLSPPPPLSLSLSS